MIETECHPLVLWVRVRAWDVTSETAQRLRETFERFPGITPVLVELFTESGEPKYLRLSDQYRVSVEPELWNALAEVPAVDLVTLGGMTLEDNRGPSTGLH
jgi:hypothetical protein